MTLEIVWRNPFPLASPKNKVQRVRRDEFGAVYAVSNPDLTQEFELIVGHAA